MTKYLFLGGPLDGQRVAVPPDAAYWRHVVAPEIDFAVTCDPVENQLSYYTYQKHRISEKEWVFWYADGGVVHPVALLVRKYPDPTASDELKRAVRKLSNMLPDIYRGMADLKEVAALRTKLYKLTYEPNPSIP